MTNTELEHYMTRFIDKAPDNDQDTWTASTKGYYQAVMADFVHFLKQNRVKISMGGEE